MPIKVRIPTPLQKLTKDAAEVEAAGATLKAVIDDLERQFPGFRDRICDETGKIRRFVNVYVNEEDARFQQAEATPVKDGDEISIIPAIAGGRR
jgi:molybdopterin synthase sulfur carrier subunit